MTYLEFHLLFIVPPVLLLATSLRASLRALGPRATPTLVALPLVALVYTTPWDAYLIRTGVWSYGAERVLGSFLGIPYEEYAFFVLQPLLTAMLFFRLLARLRTVDPLPPLERPARVVRGAGTVLALLWVAIGFALLQREEGRYLGLILVWALPVLAGMWAWRGDAIWRWKAATIPAVALSTAWLWVADRTAIRAGTWQISERYTLGWNPADLPVEEATFFLVTNLMVVGGAVLFLEPGLKGKDSDPVAEPVQDQT